MHTLTHQDDKDVKKNQKDMKDTMNDLLDEQEWMNFKLGLLAEH